MARPPDSDPLKEAMWRPMSVDKATLHRDAIGAAVAEAGRSPRRSIRTRRRFSTIAVIAALLALPAGVAVAADEALPGDALYPVKRVTETVRSWIDRDIVAEHRVEELEASLASDVAPERVAELVDRAVAEVDRLDPDHPLQERLSELAGDDRRQIHDRTTSTTTPPVDRPDPTAPVDAPTTTTPTTTTTIVTDRPTTTIVDRVATTTTVADDRPTVRVGGVVLAGPTCPVERIPPDPACEDQPVPGAVMLVTDEQGDDVTSVESDTDGRFRLRLEPGRYVLVPQPYDGLLGTAPAQEFVVEAEEIELLVAYDTGIR